MSNITLRKTFQPIIILCLFIFFALSSWAAESSDMIQASNWIDREVYGQNGEEFGEIDDLVIKRSGKIKRITIEVGGFLDIGDKLVAVSPSEFQNLMVEGDGKIVLDTTEEKMEKRSEFDYYRQGLRPDYYYRRGYHRRFGYRSFPPPYLRSKPYGPPASEWQAEPYPEGDPGDWAFSPSRFLASTLIDREVINESGGYIGRVTDLLIDIRDAKVKKMIVAVNDFGDGPKRVAFPYEPPGFTAYGIVCDVSSEEIRKLPSYPDEK